MKKKILGILIIIIMFFITGCSTKDTMSADAFKNKMEKKGFAVSDQTAIAKGTNSSVEKSYIATKTDMTYAIEYYSFDGEISAQAFYAQKRDYFAGIGAPINTEVNNGNYSKYANTYNGKYGVISKVSNTAIYVNADNIYEEEIKSILKDIGY